jgi:hypothetical protein
MELRSTLSSTCAACKALGALEVVESFDGNALTWTERFVCDCGYGFEAKNAGLPLPAVREALMSRHGRFVVVVRSIPEGGKTLSVLSKLLATSLAELRDSLKTLPRQVWEGTSLETQLMQMAFTKSGAVVDVEQVGRSNVRSLGVKRRRTKKATVTKARRRP